MTNVIEGTAVEETGVALEPVAAAPPASLFRTDDPVEVLKRAKATVARELWVAARPMRSSSGLRSRLCWSQCCAWSRSRSPETDR